MIQVTVEESVQALYKCVFMGVGIDLAFGEYNNTFELLEQRRKLYKPSIVKLYKHGKTINQLSREFGINRHTITGWVNKQIDGREQ